MTEEIDLETRLAAAITDPDFEKLELAMREPDIFRALAIERQEIRHSNFFAFLLDPAGSATFSCGNSCATYLLTAGRRDAHCLTRI